MKKFLLLLFAVFLTASVPAQDKQFSSTEKNVFKVNTLSLLIGTGSVFYEREFSDLLSGQMGVSYTNFKFWDTRFKGTTLTPEVRIYPKKNGVDGFYLAPYFRYQQYSLEDDDEDFRNTLTSFGGGFLLGRQWIRESGFTMDFFFGGHYGKADTSEEESGINQSSYNIFEGFKMRTGFALGFAF